MDFRPVEQWDEGYCIAGTSYGKFCNRQSETGGVCCHQHRDRGLTALGYCMVCEKFGAKNRIIGRDAFCIHYSCMAGAERAYTRNLLPQDRCYVYCITDEQYHKFGMAKDVQARLRGLQGSNPRRLRIVWTLQCGPFAKRIEGAIHRHLEGFRVFGEWFSITQGDVEGAISFAHDCFMSNLGLR